MSTHVINNKMVVLNFTEEYCKNEIEVLNSECFKRVFFDFLDYMTKHERVDIIYLVSLLPEREHFIGLFKLLYSFEYDQINDINFIYRPILKERALLYKLVEEFYNYWRRLERYSIIKAKKIDQGVQNMNFVDANKEFTNIILKTYRTISERLYGQNFSIYRQLPSGVNASLLVNDYKWCDIKEYDYLNNIQMIESVMIRPPFMSYSKKNKRTGTYQESKTNPLLDVNLNSNDYLCYPCYVGGALAFVYFHKHFMAHGITISNLFDFAAAKDIRDKKPNIIYLFGYGDEESSFFYDKENDIYIGRAPLADSVDYFGYMKKMLLTLYNVKMISEGGLPIHGACVHITLKGGQKKTVVIIGDSGAGKSETLEALRASAGDDIIDMRTIFDDMGTFKLVNGQVYAYGTEIGAFVRLDDMASDFGYKEMDRAIFMNPDAQNARLVIPVATYPEIMEGHKVDFIFYANNYENTDNVKKFESVDEALEVFIGGARMAKGTTGEVGLVKSFFANPFGPVQKEEKTRELLDLYFTTLFKNNIYVGELYTKLAIPGYEQNGPKNMAVKLFDLLRGIN